MLSADITRRGGCHHYAAALLGNLGVLKEEASEVPTFTRATELRGAVASAAYV